MKKFFYKTVDVPRKSSKELEDLLNYYGQDGWELIIIQNDVMYFKMVVDIKETSHKVNWITTSYSKNP